MSQATSISVCIISNKVDDVLLRELGRLQSADLEVHVGLNGEACAEVDALSDRFRQVRFHELTWQGYGQTKNALAELASTSWIFSLDSDEEMDDTLIQFLCQPPELNPDTAYLVRRGNMLNGKKQRFGIWGKSHQYVARLYHREFIYWNHAPVHEELVMPHPTNTQRIPGNIWNHTAKDIREVREKNLHYAQLLVQDRGDKKTPWYKKTLSPFFAFIRSYIVLLGFLDGKSGYQIAKEYARYTWWKYNL